MRVTSRRPARYMFVTRSSRFLIRPRACSRMPRTEGCVSSEANRDRVGSVRVDMGGSSMSPGDDEGRRTGKDNRAADAKQVAGVNATDMTLHVPTKNTISTFRLDTSR